MRYGHTRIRLYRHLEHVEAAGGVVFAVKKPELERAEVDGFRHKASSEGSPPRGRHRPNRNVAQEQAQYCPVAKELPFLLLY
jgi:hypothetical protein